MILVNKFSWWEIFESSMISPNIILKPCCSYWHCFADDNVDKDPLRFKRSGEEPVSLRGGISLFLFFFFFFCQVCHFISTNGLLSSLFIQMLIKCMFTSIPLFYGLLIAQVLMDELKLTL
jgi:hypothetical protein